ncbi:MAG TPA: DUF2251 domain-containing protein [Candidatus Polarisedimenticolia bacterium]|nr:DUF2251 domain-containing protein [Candidatus Polarisedimenticolia bacterium]
MRNPRRLRGRRFSVILRINGYPHAAFDFVKSRGYCRTGFTETCCGRVFVGRS